MLEINSEWNSKWIAFNFNLIRILIFHAMLTIESNLFISNPVKCEAINSRDGRNKFLSIFTIFSLSPLSPSIRIYIRKFISRGESIDNCINVRHFVIKTLINISRAHTRNVKFSQNCSRKTAHQGEKIFACHKYSKNRRSKFQSQRASSCIVNLLCDL